MYVACLQYVYTLYRYSDTNMYVCMYVCLDVHDVCILYIYIHTVCVCCSVYMLHLSVCPPIDLPTCIPIHLCIDLPVCLSVQVSSRRHPRVHACIHTCIRAHLDACVYIYIHDTHTHACTSAVFPENARDVYNLWFRYMEQFFRNIAQICFRNVAQIVQKYACQKIFGVIFMGEGVHMHVHAWGKCMGFTASLGLGPRAFPGLVQKHVV